MSRDIQKYTGAYNFGLLDVDKVTGASSGSNADRAAPWVRELRPSFENNFPACSLYCSNRGASFNEVEVKSTYPTHVFIWRTLRRGKQKTTSCTYTVRVFSGSQMQALVNDAVAKNKVREKTVTQGGQKITIREASISVTKILDQQKKEIEETPKMFTKKINITDQLKPYAIACSMRKDIERKKLIKPLLTELGNAIQSL